MVVLKCDPHSEYLESTLLLHWTEHRWCCGILLFPLVLYLLFISSTRQQENNPCTKYLATLHVKASMTKISRKHLSLNLSQSEYMLGVIFAICFTSTCNFIFENFISPAFASFCHDSVNRKWSLSTLLSIAMISSILNGHLGPCNDPEMGRSAGISLQMPEVKFHIFSYYSDRKDKPLCVSDHLCLILVFFF